MQSQLKADCAVDYQGRIDRLAEACAAHEVDGFLISRLVHVRYFTGFSGSNGAAAIFGSSAVLVTDSRYDLQARSESPHCEIRIERAVLSEAVVALEASGAKRIGVEPDYLSHTQFRDLETLVSNFGGVLVPMAGAIESLRIIKDADEIAHIASACEITSVAWWNVVSRGVIGKTELALAAEVEAEFRYLGAEDRAFESIVATGPHSAIPHHQPTQRVVQSGDLLKMDIGARVAGYHADMTRTVAVGRPDDWQSEIYAAVSGAQSAALAISREGTDSQALATVIRERHEADGFAHLIQHQPGHGVGLEIHEKPFLGRGDGILRQGMPITVEPGLYLPGRGGVRIEDTIEILSGGYRFLTTANRELISV